MSSSSSRKRRYRVLQSNETFSSQPPLKRQKTHNYDNHPSLSRSLSTPNFCNQIINNNNSNRCVQRQNYLRDHLSKLKDDPKISDVTFVLTKIVNSKQTSKNNTQSPSAASLSGSDDDDDDDDISNNNNNNNNNNNTIIIKKKYQCIKALFAAYSDVFKSLLYGKMYEASVFNPEIELKDITCNAFEYIRDLFYQFNPQLTYDVVLDVLVASHKYFINPLMNECINFLRNLSNVNKWYNILYEIQDKYLNNFGIEIYFRALIDENYMINNCSNLIFNKLNKLYKLNINILSRIIKSSNLYILDEIIWHKCIGYSIYHTQLKLKLDSNHCIRIPKDIQILINKHLTIPIKLFNEMKNQTNNTISVIHNCNNNNNNNNNHINSNNTNNYNVKNYEKIIIQESDIFIMDNDNTINDDIIKEENDTKKDNNNDDNNNNNDDDDNELDKLFVSTFREIMLQLSTNIRFPLISSLFFIKLVQISCVLPLEHVIEIQNYHLCNKIKPTSYSIKKREKRYLKYFQNLQTDSYVDNDDNNNNDNSIVTVTESEDQKNDKNNDICINIPVVVPRNGFYNHEMYLNDYKFNLLSIYDHIDHRDNVGRFATAIIVDINQNNKSVKLHYIGWQSKWDLWCDISSKYNRIRFCKAGSISTRKVHRIEFKDGLKRDLIVRVRLAKYWYKNHKDVDQHSFNKWRNATIKRIDKHSGQIQLVVRIGSKDYLWWTHADNLDEIQPYYTNNTINNSNNNNNNNSPTLSTMNTQISYNDFTLNSMPNLELVHHQQIFVDWD